MTYDEKCSRKSLERVHMELLKHTTDVGGLKDRIIKILIVLQLHTYIQICAKLDYQTPDCSYCPEKRIPKQEEVRNLIFYQNNT